MPVYAATRTAAGGLRVHVLIQIPAVMSTGSTPVPARGAGTPLVLPRIRAIGYDVTPRGRRLRL